MQVGCLDRHQGGGEEILQSHDESRLKSKPTMLTEFTASCQSEKVVCFYIQQVHIVFEHARFKEMLPTEGSFQDSHNTNTFHWKL